MMDLAPAETPAVEISGTCEPFVVPRFKTSQPEAEPTGIERTLDRGAYLFREGETKTAAYRLEAGILCVTSRRPVGPPEVVEMLFPGTLLGLGFLDRHIDSAMAVVPCRITEFPLSAVSALCDASESARDRQASLTEREFAARRREVAPDPAERPLRRVAAFLSAMYHMNRHEGRNPAFVAEFLKSGDVAAFLDLEVEELAAALTDLRQRGFVGRAESGGLVLLDPEGLERLAT